MLDILDVSHHQGTGLVGQRRAVVDFVQAKAAGCAAVIIRTTYGLMIDELAAEHNRRADAAELPRMYYAYVLSRQDPHTQGELAFHYSGGQSGRRGWCDIEESASNDGQDPKWPRYSWDRFHHINEFLAVTDSLTGMSAGIYSSKTYMDYWFTPDQQAPWSHRPGWWAHYTSLPSPRIPKGWEHKPRPYELWQYAIGRWPGFAGGVDLNYAADGVTVAELMGTAPAPPPPDPASARIAALAGRIAELVSG